MIGTPRVVLAFPKAAFQSNRPPAAPELTAFIDAIRSLHEHDPVAFYCLTRKVNVVADGRNVPARALRVLRKFIEEWD